MKIIGEICGHWVLERVPGFHATGPTSTETRLGKWVAHSEFYLRKGIWVDGRDILHLVVSYNLLVDISSSESHIDGS